MNASDQELVSQFTRAHSEDAFALLVNRYLNLVYSAALRQVRSPQLAEEVCQSVFTNLAYHAPKLKPNTVLTAWLYQVTRNAAIDVVRREARRQEREQIALQMSQMHTDPSEWTQIEPMLDEAMRSLDDAERTAILLRYFENKSLRDVGQALGTSEDAAQKRVSRAVERLRDYFSKRKITVGASGLVALVSANAIQAAPTGLATTVAAGALTTSAALSTATAVAVTKTIAMTTIQKTIITTLSALAAGAIIVSVYQAHKASSLREEVQALKQQQQVSLNAQMQELQRERDGATNALAALAAENAALKKNPPDVAKLRGEVGRLRMEKTSLGSTSALSKVTANAAAKKMLRDQQKLGMSMIYKGFAQQLKLTEQQTDQLNDLLADHIMNNVDHVTAVLRDKLTPEQMNELFTTQDAALHAQLQELLGQDGLSQYQDYTKNLLSTLTAEQFKGMLSGNDTAKQEKVKQLSQVIQSTVQDALTKAGLPADYQLVPTLNFSNIASEQEGERNLKLLDDIYQRATAQAGSFLSPEELIKFKQFTTTAISNNRAALALNRTMMAPIGN
ncbi:MAG TPA: sigma-70 family RNA polymerase sigma factor [Candidatus Limnocylindrales bacterium]|jgi:RNA polymerase sigma factor (sigma-70 family)|nr:sigma-70 family RNA polymerase sigma factor [Candidatus Limnocylindrales bacterium]